jgi:hypothetical protein
MRLTGIAGLVASVLLVTGCGGGESTDSQEPTPQASEPTETAAETPSGTAGFSADEQNDLFQAVTRLVEDERKQGGTLSHYATDRERARSLLDQVAKILPKTLPTHPEGGSVLLQYAVAKYDTKALLRCSSSSAELNVVLVADAAGQTFTVIMATDSVASFLIYDYEQRGKQTFDKTGYAVGSGACETSGEFPILADARKTL